MVEALLRAMCSNQAIVAEICAEDARIATLFDDSDASDADE